MAGSVAIKFVANATGLKKGTDQSKQALSGFEKATKTASSNIKKALGGIAAAFGAAAIVRGLANAAKAAQEDAISQKLLADQLKRTTGANAEAIKGAEGFIDALSRQVGIADDQLRPALANAVRGTGSLTAGQKLLAIAVDGAAASGKPLDTVLNALIKAQNGNTASLYKLAPELKKAKGGIDDYAASVKGAGEAAASPFDKFKVAIGEAQEKLGASLLPVIQKLIDKFLPLIDKIVPALIKVIDALIPIIDMLIPVVLQLVDALLPFVPVVGEIITALTPLIAALLPPLIDLFKQLTPVLVPLIKLLVDLLVPIIKILAAVLQPVIGFVVGLIKNFTGLGTAILGAFKGMGGFFKPLVNGYLSIWGGFINFILDGLNLIPKALNGIKIKVPDWVPIIGGKTIGFNLPTFSKFKVPQLANGGVVMPRPGGTLANIAEAGRAEAVIPLDKFGALGGNVYTININRAQLSGIDVITAIRRYEKQSGRRYLLGNA
jgi:hypothetical protein